MVSSELGACEWFVWDLRRSNLLDRGRLDQIVGEFLQKNPRAEPPALAEYLIGVGILTDFQAERLLQGKTQGFVLGPFTLMDALGAGSMGTVYKAQSKTDNGWYAVKVLPRRSMWNVRLARRKVRAFEACQHPSVVPFVDVGTSGGMHYLAWPLVEGETLDKKMQTAGKLPHGLAAHYAMQIAEGLDVCHQQGLIHGLVKPSNLMIAPDNSQVHILDFGIGCLLAETEGESLVDTMSTANAVASGLDCSSPESIMEPTNLTPVGDQYSLGCTLYYMLTGQYPFPDGTAAEKMMAHQLKSPTPIAELAPETPPGLIAVVDRLLQKTPDQRYHSTHDAVDALTPFADFDTGRRSSATQREASLRKSLTGSHGKSLTGSHGKTPAAAATHGGQASVSSRTPPPATPKLAGVADLLNPQTPRSGTHASPVRPAAPAAPRPQTMVPGGARPATMQALPLRDSARSAKAPATAPIAKPVAQQQVPQAPRPLQGEEATFAPDKNWLERIGPIGTAIIATVICCVVFTAARYFRLL